MDKITAGNKRGQLAGSGVWVQVAEIFKTGEGIQKLHASERTKRLMLDKEEKRKG